jgi:hypothetical protein
LNSRRCSAPLTYFIPLAALAGLLLVVCWNMAEKREFAHLLRDWSTAIVVLATVGLTVADLTLVGIIVGCIAAVAMAYFWGEAAPNIWVLPHVRCWQKADIDWDASQCPLSGVKQTFRPVRVVFNQRPAPEYACLQQSASEPALQAGFRFPASGTQRSGLKAYGPQPRFVAFLPNDGRWKRISRTASKALQHG